MPEGELGEAIRSTKGVAHYGIRKAKVPADEIESSVSTQSRQIRGNDCDLHSLWKGHYDWEL